MVSIDSDQHPTPRRFAAFVLSPCSFLIRTSRMHRSSPTGTPHLSSACCYNSFATSVLTPTTLRNPLTKSPFACCSIFWMQLSWAVLIKASNSCPHPDTPPSARPLLGRARQGGSSVHCSQQPPQPQPLSGSSVAPRRSTLQTNWRARALTNRSWDHTGPFPARIS